MRQAGSLPILQTNEKSQVLEIHDYIYRKKILRFRWYLALSLQRVYTEAGGTDMNSFCGGKEEPLDQIFCLFIQQGLFDKLSTVVYINRQN